MRFLILVIATTMVHCSNVSSCLFMTCPVGEVCKYLQNKSGSLHPRCVVSCNNSSIEPMLCGVGGVCPDGFSCSGCQERCGCDSDNAVPCPQGCRPTCTPNLHVQPAICYDLRSPPSKYVMDICCNTTGRFCKEDLVDEFVCRSNPVLWTPRQRDWCCKEKHIGCPSYKYDCSIDDEMIQIDITDDGLQQVSMNVSYVSWGEEKAAYCCDKFQIGCPDSYNVFDCNWSSSTHSVWTEEQSAWCCSVKGIRCSKPPSVFESCQAKKEVRDLWDERTRKRCCLTSGVGCASDKYDCYGDEKKMSEWSEKQIEWCCNEENIACKVDCGADADLLSKEERSGCCHSKGLHCTNTTDKEDTTHHYNTISLRLSFKSKYSKIMLNPKKFLRKLRTTILKVTKVLQPHNLMINFVGGLMKDNIIPPKEVHSRWGRSIPQIWNMELIDGSPVSWNGTEASSNNGMMSGQINVEDEGVFVDIELSGDNRAVVEEGCNFLRLAISESRVGGGPLRDNSEGATLILLPLGSGFSPLDQRMVTGSPSNSNINIHAIILYSVIAVSATLVCLLGAHTIYRKAKAQLKDNEKTDSVPSAGIWIFFVPTKIVCK